MKKVSKRLALNTQTVRVLQNDDLAGVAGGTQSGTSVISASGGTSVISNTSVISASGTIGTSGPSVISIKTH